MKVNTFSKEFNGEKAKIAIVRSRFNEAVTGRMLDAAVDTLKNSQVQEENINITEVPGVFEIPVMVQKYLKEGGYDAVLTIGCVLRGETPHDVYICDATIPNLVNLSLEYSVPVLLGVITPVNQEQADVRSTGEGNKGIEVAKAALEMIELMA
jgi:6,7-dimethyl-8-ribityllumazine synthase